MIYTIFGGFCMALADSVPGVSGGTIAFILGFYDNFIGSLHTLFHGNLAEKKNCDHVSVENRRRMDRWILDGGFPAGRSVYNGNL